MSQGQARPGQAIPPPVQCVLGFRKHSTAQHSTAQHETYTSVCPTTVGLLLGLLPLVVTTAKGSDLPMRPPKFLRSRADRCNCSFVICPFFLLSLPPSVGSTTHLHTHKRAESRTHSKPTQHTRRRGCGKRDGDSLPGHFALAGGWRQSDGIVDDRWFAAVCLFFFFPLLLLLGIQKGTGNLLASSSGTVRDDDRFRFEMIQRVK